MTEKNSEFLQNILDNGFPSEWKSIKDVSMNWDIPNAGWKVKISHGKTSIPNVDCMGMYAEEDCKEGQMLRLSWFGQNVLEMDSDLKNVIQFSSHNKEFELFYLANYGARIHNGPEDKIHMWIPGCGINHVRDDPSVIIRYHESFDFEGTSGRALAIHAMRDIVKGEELLLNYDIFGEYPDWWQQLLEKHGQKNDLAIFLRDLKKK